MNKPPKIDRAAYHAQMASWAQDAEAANARSRRTAWIVAGVATTVAALEALAIISLAPLKTVVPYTVLVDRTTGYTQTIDGTHPQLIKPQSALLQSMLAQYVIARETFDLSTTAEQYRKVSLWSAGEARAVYLALMPTSNPQSPLNLYPRAALVTTTVESVSVNGAQSADVRFVTERRDNPSAAPVRNYWVAQLRFRFTGEPMSVDDRLDNPLGFQVTDYRRDQEAPPAPVATAPVVTSAAPVTVAPGTVPVTAPNAPLGSTLIGPRPAPTPVPRPAGTP
ncbi:MAG: virB8 family protein [Sphingomonas sp.]